MKKIYIILGISLILSSCADFLAVNPNKAGDASIHHMDQLYGLMGNSETYNKTGTYLWSEAAFMTDDTDITPYFYSKVNNSNAYMVSVWDKNSLENGGFQACSWNGSFKSIFDFNTALEYLDKVEQSTEQVKEQVRGEALFGRAYFHFYALVMYSKYELDAPSVGYRDNTMPASSGLPTRETFEYTIGRIEKDLADAEVALKKAGRTEFEIKRNFRITLPTLNAFRARFELYRGNYEKALVAANEALKGHSVLLDFKNDPLYEVKNPFNVDVLDASGAKVGELPYSEMTQLAGEANKAIIEYEELYIPHFTDLYFSNRTIPMSESLYNLFDKNDDERWKRFYNNNYCVAKEPSILTTGKFGYEAQQNIKEWTRHTYHRFLSRAGSSGKAFLIGPTTAEMYLIKAECLSRAGNQGEAQQALQMLRRTRFTTDAAANNIGGTVQDVLDERRRELTSVFRWYDLKRLNGKENANISITRKRHTDFQDKNSAIIDDILLPNDPRYAVPIPLTELILMGWKQN